MKYGWIPDLPDARDRKFVARARNLKSLPPSIDWTPQLPPIYDQGQLGSCTAQALAAAFSFLHAPLPPAPRSTLNDPTPPSRLFLYWNERLILGSTDQDSGAMIRDGVKSLVSDGCCPESLWPYDPARVLVQPPEPCYDAADTCTLQSYSRVDSTLLEDLLEALTFGPVVGGFSVYESFESDKVARTGLVPMPGPDESVIGGHAIVVSGYDQVAKRFRVRNSWGPIWGHRGSCFFPFDYFTHPDLAADFWLLSNLA